MSNSPRRSAAQPVDGVLASAMQRLTNALDTTTDVDGRLTAALYAAALPPAPPVSPSVDTLLDRGRQELQATLEATTDVESHLILALHEIDLEPQTGSTSDE
ncbi:hypothetical protein [Streptomyces dysideae]|uniref:Uncharacterized protein n=1 Tax=Streptomyces dysideae TaxID=909626 RepID=A0A117RYC3_9ACTN|nr:hypothetical protein [Streptomyces dysideae]KUO15962.1 hypothetical protein AQJ91_38770 [Streptomyces dysideae]